MKKILKILSYILKGIVGVGFLFGILLTITKMIETVVNFLFHFKILKLMLIWSYCAISSILVLMIGLGIILVIEDKIKNYFRNRKREKRNYE